MGTDPPAGRRRTRLARAPRQSQQHSGDTVFGGGKRQTPAGGEIHPVSLADHRRKAARPQALLHGPENVLFLGGRNEQQARRIEAETREPMAVKPAGFLGHPPALTPQDRALRPGLPQPAEKREAKADGARPQPNRLDGDVVKAVAVQLSLRQGVIDRPDPNLPGRLGVLPVRRLLAEGHRALLDLRDAPLESLKPFPLRGPFRQSEIHAWHRILHGSSVEQKVNILNRLLRPEKLIKLLQYLMDHFAGGSDSGSVSKMSGAESPVAGAPSRISDARFCR
jgi:hypothetical protein